MWSEPPSWLVHPLARIIILIAGVIGVALVVLLKREKPDSLDDKIAVDFTPVIPPIIFPADGLLNLVTMRPLRSSFDGYYRLHASPGDEHETSWNGVDRFDIVNFSDIPIFALWFVAEIRFYEAKHSQEGTIIGSGKLLLSKNWKIEIDRLGVGETFSIYVQNDLDEYAYVELPTRISFKRLGSQLEETARLIRPRNTTIVFPPPMSPEEQKIISREINSRGDIVISLGDGDEFERTELRNLYSVARTKGVVLKNSKPTRSIIGAKVYLTELEPYAGHRLPRLIASDISLDPDEEHFVPIATYIEGQGSVSHDTMMILEITGEEGIAADLDNTLRLKVTANDTAPSEIRCRAHVTNGTLHLDKA